MPKKQSIYPGEVFKVCGGESCTVVEYYGCSNVVIRFNDRNRHEMVVQASHLRRGSVKNPFRPVVYGVGFIGVGPHSAGNERKRSPAYAAWRNMLRRCYDNAYKEKYPTYVGCSVHKDWHNFQIFAEWFCAQPNAGVKDFDLDKDLAVLGNKEYSEKTCSFVPRAINSLLTDRGAARGLQSIGVCLHKGRYRAEVKVDGKAKYLGVYKTPEDASAAYRRAKESNVRRMAEIYKDLIDDRVYFNLSNYKVEM